MAAFVGRFVLGLALALAFAAVALTGSGIEAITAVDRPVVVGAHRGDGDDVWCC